MNRYTMMMLLMPLAGLAGLQSVSASTPSCKAPVMTPDHGAIYADRDGTARLDDHYDMQDPVRAAFINAAVKAHPENERLRLGRGSALALMHRRADAERDFQAALARHPERAHTHWSYGWALFNVGDDACALRQWQQAAKISGGHPYWLPYAVAESYWRLGRRQLALRWYGAAVRSQPSRWGSVASIRASTYGRNWSDEQRDMLIEMFHAWHKQAASGSGGGSAMASASTATSRR